MKLYYSHMLMLVYVLVIACLHCTLAARNGGNGQHGINGLLNDVTPEIRNSLNSQKVGYHFYSKSEYKPVEIVDEEDISSSLAAHFDFGINFNSSCYADLAYTLANMQNLKNPWALEMVDSFGKPEAGILQGNLKWIGNYHECVNVYAPPMQNFGEGKTTVGDFHGQYCFLQYNVHLPGINLTITSGACIPDTCSANTLTKDFATLLFIAKAIPSLKGSQYISNVKMSCKRTSKPLNVPAKAMIGVMVFFGILALLGSSVTVYEYIFKETRLKGEVNNINSLEINDGNEVVKTDASPNEHSGVSENCKQFMKCFCVFTNGSKLLNTDANEGQLLCLHGIRFLSMTWVILCHTFSVSLSMFSNYKEALNLMDTIAFQVILNGFYAVDPFFVLSGFLLSYLFFQEYSKRKGQMSWVYFYIHRYLRLTPVYMIALAFSSTVYLYLASGPFWLDDTVNANCKASWWGNLLYINNFLDPNIQCMAWSWYLANDMQFFVISPLFLILLYKYPKIGFSLVGVTFVATSVVNFALTYHYDLICGIGDLQNIANRDGAMDQFGVYYDKIYIKPYGRIGPYLVGLFLGYILFAEKLNNKPKLSWITLCFGWVVASVVTSTFVFGLYHQYPTKLAASFYNAFNRTCFGAGLAWVIYVCLKGQGGIVNSILSFKLFIPLSRVTYCAYLIHPMVVTRYLSSLKTTLYYSNETLVILFIGFVVVTYAFSFLMSLIFESPLIGLEKLIRKKFKS